MSTVLPDPSTPFGERVARRLRDERLIWLTTTSADGTPQPNPVWFLWDGASFLIYNLKDAKRLEHIRANPHVALHFDGDGQGGDIIVFTGAARITTDDPPADHNSTYVQKYDAFIARAFQTPERFAERYPVTVRVTPSRVRGH